MLIKERIIKIIEYKGIPKEEFYVKIGMTSANFRGKAKQTPINSTAIENILSEIPDVNPNWLLTGNGSMLKDGDVKSRSQLIFGDNNQMAGTSLKNNELAQEILKLKALVQQKDDIINKLLKQQEKLIDKLVK